MKTKITKLSAVVTAFLMAITPLSAHAERIGSSDDFIPKDVVYDPEIDYAFPNNPDLPFITTIREKGYYKVEVMSPNPTMWDMVYYVTEEAPTGLYVDTFSGKMRCKIIFCYPGNLTIYGTGPFFATVESADGKTADVGITMSIHRFYNSNNGEHLFTGNLYEAATLIKAGWTYEGIAFSTGTMPIVGCPIYRNYDGVRHSYSYEWRDDTEGFAFRIPENVHLLRSDSDTLLTTNDKEYWNLLELGWTDCTC